MSSATGSGYISNYNDSGYTYNYTSYASGTSGTNPSSDTYTTTVQCGVYMIDLSGSTSPINCSIHNFSDAGIPNSVDDGWLVYPGYSIQLFNNAGYDTTNTYSQVITNITTSPVLYCCNLNQNNLSTYTNPGFWTAPTSFVYYAPAASPQKFYSINQTTSVYVWFRGVQIFVEGLS